MNSLQTSTSIRSRREGKHFVTRGLNLLFASTSAGANRSYYGSSYTSINIYSRFSLSPYGYYTLAVYSHFVPPIFPVYLSSLVPRPLLPFCLVSFHFLFAFYLSSILPLPLRPQYAFSLSFHFVYFSASCESRVLPAHLLPCLFSF